MASVSSLRHPHGHHQQRQRQTSTTFQSSSSTPPRPAPPSTVSGHRRPAGANPQTKSILDSPNSNPIPTIISSASASASAPPNNNINNLYKPISSSALHPRSRRSLPFPASASASLYASPSATQSSLASTPDSLKSTSTAPTSAALKPKPAHPRTRVLSQSHSQASSPSLRSSRLSHPVSTPSPLTHSRLGNHRRALESHDQPQELDDELVTEVPEHGELDDEMQAALAAVVAAHSNQLASLRRLLSSADHGSSMTMHLLHAEIKTLHDTHDADVREIDRLRKSVASLGVQLERARAIPPAIAHTGSIVDVLSKSSDDDLKQYFRTLRPAARLHLLHLLLEAAVPGDLRALRVYLDQIERSKRDFVSMLPDNLAVRCMLYLDVPSILCCRLVSKRWDDVICRSGRSLWRALSLSLTSKDDEQPRPREDTSEGWFALYKGLHYREENWRRGLAQRVVVLKGHTGSIGAIKLRGTTLVTGSLDGTLRIWNVRTSNCLKTVKMPAPVSSLDFYGQYGPGGVIAAGGNDVGRVFLISMNGNLLSTLSGHNKGIRTVAMNSEYLVSGGYDKALVVWNWKEGTRIVKFGQQTNPCAAISLFGSTFSSVQVDGVIRCFSIANRELVSQHKVQGSNERGHEKIGGEMFQWFVAEARRVIIATKTMIYQLEYNLGSDGQTVDLSSAPRLVSMTAIVHELNSGTLDVLKRRFAAAPRFATRLGDDMRIFIGHLPESSNEVRDDGQDDLQPIEGAWLDAEASVSSRNPTCMSLSSDQLVVGCSDGVLYALDFCGTGYRRKRSIGDSGGGGNGGGAGEKIGKDQGNGSRSSSGSGGSG